MSCLSLRHASGDTETRRRNKLLLPSNLGGCNESPDKSHVRKAGFVLAQVKVPSIMTADSSWDTLREARNGVTVTLKTTHLRIQLKSLRIFDMPI